MSHTLKNMFTGPTIISELLPFLNRIISPDLKPVRSSLLPFLSVYSFECNCYPQVNSQLIKTDERLVMLKLINRLLLMKLSFIQDKNEEGQLSYKLDPCVYFLFDSVLTELKGRVWPQADRCIRSFRRETSGRYRPVSLRCSTRDLTRGELSFLPLSSKPADIYCEYRWKLR